MIVPMKFVTLVILRDDREQVLRALQKQGNLMLCEPQDATRAGAQAGAAMRRMEKLIADIKPYAPKKKLFDELPAETEAAFEAHNKEAQETAEKMETLLSEIHELKERLQKETARLEQLSPWANLSLPVEALRDSAYAVYTPGTVPQKHAESFLQACTDAGISCETVSGTETTLYVVVVSLPGQALNELSENGFEKTSIPLEQGLVGDAVKQSKEAVRTAQETLDKRQEELHALASQSHAPQLLCEQYRAQSELEDAPFIETAQTVLLEGWVPADELENAEKAIKSVTAVYDLSARDPLPDEDVPTKLHNNKTVSQFEGITNMFSVPKYGGYDPNAVMAPWYWVIFGMMMGDAGYGLMMVVLILLFKKLLKPKGETAKLANVLLYSSITTILCGVLFGSYFGETWHPILFSPLDDPVRMLILTMVLGVAHIFTGLIVQIINNVKAGHWLDAIFDQVSWILVISGLGLFFIKPARTVGIVLAVVGAVIILFTAGRAKKGVVGKITGGLVGLYGVTSYLSDILSYSRILALSLATGVVGMVMNMLAGMIQGSVIGFIFSLVIYIVGHVFNLVLGLLSAYVHDCRLQYIEFYGKFYEGSGKLFRPLSINPKYIQIKDNGGK